MKITERDKALLILLVVILIVALAIVMPGFGVMSCRDKISDYKTKTEDLEKDLDSKLDTLRNMGVKTQYAESAARASEALKEDIFDMKMEASHLAGNVMAYAKPYALDEGWVDGLEYRYGVKSEDSEKIVEYSPITNVEGGSETDETFSIGNVTYTLPSAKRDISFTLYPTAECTYEVEMTMEGYSAADLGAVILYLHNISAKGSMLITEAKISNEKTVSFTLLMPPAGSGISKYAQEIREELERRAAEEEGEEE